jgi:formylglycine-generating enzyme required for sulfatase activity
VPATRYYWGNDATYSLIGTYAWYYSNGSNQTHPAGTAGVTGHPNAFGLYDMSGNVWEWCQDWYGNYGSGAVTDPAGPATGSDRVLRGGSWYDYNYNCRSAYRYTYDPAQADSTFGLRLVR